MGQRKRTQEELGADVMATTIAGTLGRAARATRTRRRLQQKHVADAIGLSRSRYADLERGQGASAPLDTWVRIGVALGRPLAVSFSRDIEPGESRDAGHLAAQELVLRLARENDRPGTFELPTRPADPSRSTDVGLRDVRHRALILIEIWNRLADLGAAVRATDRKTAEMTGPAMFAGGDNEPYRVATCWLLVDTAANRRLVTTYPEILTSRFPGSSVAWVRCLVDGAVPPDQPGIAWIDPRSGCLRPLRHRR